MNMHTYTLECAQTTNIHTERLHTRIHMNIHTNTREHTQATQRLLTHTQIQHTCTTQIERERERERDNTHTQTDTHTHISKQYNYYTISHFGECHSAQFYSVECHPDIHF